MHYLREFYLKYGYTIKEYDPEISVIIGCFIQYKLTCLEESIMRVLEPTLNTSMNVTRKSRWTIKPRAPGIIPKYFLILKIKNSSRDIRDALDNPSHSHLFKAF